MARILVTDGDHRAALAIVRSLGLAGHEVHVLSESGRSIAGASRYSVTEGSVFPPLTRPDDFLSEIHRHLLKKEVELLIPVTDASLLAVLPQKDSLPCTIPFPDLDTFKRASDKRWVTEAAPGKGFAVPKTFLVSEPGDVKDLPLIQGDIYVLKPARSVEGGQKRSVSYAEGHEGVSRALRKLGEAVYPVLIQERVQGQGTGVFLLMWNDELRAAFAHRRIREKPPSGGVSVVRESATLDAELRDLGIQFLRGLGWQGVAMVEFKVDPKRNIPYLMEINGRFWGSVQLAIDAGVDFPRLLAEAALGYPPEPPPAFQAGVRTRWELGDLDHLLLRLTRRAGTLNLPGNAPNRTTVVKEFLRDFHPSTRNEVFRSSDPYPFFREFGNWIQGLWHH